MAEDCPTCRAVEALLVGSRRVPKPVARKIARSAPVKRADKALRGSRKVQRVKQLSDYQKKLSKHLKAERNKATKKNGDFKKGKSMQTIMKAAHKCVKKEMRKK
jgi:hypothetical protein